jgi:hypothetical protein
MAMRGRWRPFRVERALSSKQLASALQHLTELLASQRQWQIITLLGNLQRQLQQRGWQPNTHGVDHRQMPPLRSFGALGMKRATIAALAVMASLQVPVQAENWMTLMDEWRDDPTHQGAVLNQFDLDSIARCGNWVFARFRYWHAG